MYLLRNAQIEESVPFFEAAIKKQTWRNPNPYSGEGYFNLGLALEMLDRLEPAYDAFFKATWSAETAGAAYHHLSCICVKQKKLAQALKFADESLLRGWHDMKTRSLKAAILAALQEGSSTLADFVKESLAIDPLYFGVLYRQQDRDIWRRTMGGRLENYLNLAYELIGFGFYRDALEVLADCPVAQPMRFYAQAYTEKRLGGFSAQRFCEMGENANSDYCFPNQVMECLILQDAIRTLEAAGKAAPMANYYLGELLYDKKQYDQAVACWETAIAAKPDLALAHRNLSIAYFNHGDKALAPARIAAAVALEPTNSRFLLEQDQLLKRLDTSVRERLAILEAHREILSDRYALMLAYISLLNADGQHEKAYELLMNYTFHVWEGGEGKVADEYKKALLALAEKALTEEKPESAIEFAKRTLNYPVNLGEGKLENVPDNRAHYLMGCAYGMLGDAAKAEKYYRLATAGSQIPEPVRYYNDQPSDYIYYQGLAWHALGNDERAKKSFHQLVIFGEQHIFDKVGYDFFAVSMPELEVYQDDIQKRSDDYCKRMMALGRKGLSAIS